MKKTVHYYTDELNDDFAPGNIKTKETPPDFKYVHTNPIWKILEFIVYRIFVIPIEDAIRIRTAERGDIALYNAEQER